MTPTLCRSDVSDVRQTRLALPQLLAVGVENTVRIQRLNAIAVDAPMAADNPNLNEGDIVVVDVEAREGDIVLLRQGQRSLIRRLYREEDTLHLEPLDPRQPVEWAAPGEVEVVGRVVVIIRKVTDRGDGR